VREMSLSVSMGTRPQKAKKTCETICQKSWIVTKQITSIKGHQGSAPRRRGFICFSKTSFLVELRVENSYILSEEGHHTVIQLSSKKREGHKAQKISNIVDKNAHSTQHAQVKSPKVKESFLFIFCFKMNKDEK